MRAIERKRPPLMTARRWWMVVIVCLVAFGTWAGLYFREIQQPRWTEMDAVRVMAIEAAELTHVENVYKHVWDQVCWIVEGVNQNEESVFAFLNEEELLYTIHAEDSISKEALRNSFKTDHPNSEIVRISPGLMNNKPVWEIYYHRGVSAAHSYLEFYTFKDGKLVDTYQLPAKKEP